MPHFHIYKSKKTSSAAIFDDSRVSVTKLAGWECKRVIRHYKEIVTASGDQDPNTLNLWKAWESINSLLQ